MKLNTKLLFAAPIVLLIMASAPTAKAWDYGPENGGGPGASDGIGLGHLIAGLEQNFGLWGGQAGGGWYHQGAYQNGYYAGTQDAIYDHDDNLQFNPIGQCLPCHSDEYWSNFHEGYDHQWNTYQSQESNQGSSINIYGNNNYVSTNQYSNQQQNPLQQLARTFCGIINCQNNQPPLPQQTRWGP